MDLASRKLHFVEEYLKLTNVHIIERLEIVLREEKQKALNKSQQPFSEDEFLAKLDASEEDIRQGKLHSQEQVEAYFAQKAIK
jgi:hypothetical protein